MIIDPCVEYGKPMSKQKEIWTGHESSRTDGHTDRQTDRQTDRRTDRVISN